MLFKTRGEAIAAALDGLGDEDPEVDILDAEDEQAHAMYAGCWCQPEMVRRGDIVVWIHREAN